MQDEVHDVRWRCGKCPPIAAASSTVPSSDSNRLFRRPRPYRNPHFKMPLCREAARYCFVMTCRQTVLAFDNMNVCKLLKSVRAMWQVEPVWWVQTTVGWKAGTWAGFHLAAYCRLFSVCVPLLLKLLPSIRQWRLEISLSASCALVI